MKRQRNESLLACLLTITFLTSLLILGCARETTPANMDNFSNSGNGSGYGNDTSGLDLGENEFDTNNPSLPPDSGNQEQPGLTGLNESNATNGPANMPISNPTEQDWDALASSFQQLYKDFTAFEPKNLPQAVQDVMQQWYCQAVAEYNQANFYYYGSSTLYDVVTGYHLDVLGRYPNSAGHEAWMNKLYQRGPRPVALGILRSKVHADRKARSYTWHFLRKAPSTSTTNNIRALFKGHKDELKPKLNNLQTTYTIEEALARTGAYYESGLFWTRIKANHSNPTAQYRAYVRGLMRKLLGRTGASWEVEHFRYNRLNPNNPIERNYNSAGQRLKTARQIVTSDEFRLKFLTGAFNLYLARNPTGAEYYYLMNRMKDGRDMMMIMADILSTNEYMKRQATRFDPVTQRLCQ